MDTSTWIAAISAGIAALAFVIGGRALELQRAQAATSIRQEFDDLVRQLWLALGKTFGNLENPLLGATEMSRVADSAAGEIQTLALRADEILHPATKDDQKLRRLRRLWRVWRPSDERPHPSWFDAEVLASSFAEVWDLERARTYWDLAVRLATGPDVKEGAIAQVLTLRELGAFYYIDSTDSGLRTARDAFKRAVGILQPEIHGTDRAYYQNSVTLFIQAQLEDGLNNIELASQCILRAWDLSANIKVFWRRQQARYQIASFVAFVMSDNDVTRAARYDGLPGEILHEANKLRIQQQESVMPWHQQFSPGQQPAFIPPTPTFIPPPPPLVPPPTPGSVLDSGAPEPPETSSPPDARS